MELENKESNKAAQDQKKAEVKSQMANEKLKTNMEFKNAEARENVRNSTNKKKETSETKISDGKKENQRMSNGKHTRKREQPESDADKKNDKESKQGDEFHKVTREEHIKNIINNDGDRILHHGQRGLSSITIKDNPSDKQNILTNSIENKNPNTDNVAQSITNQIRALESQNRSLEKNKDKLEENRQASSGKENELYEGAENVGKTIDAVKTVATMAVDLGAIVAKGSKIMAKDATEEIIKEGNNDLIKDAVKFVADPIMDAANDNLAEKVNKNPHEGMLKTIVEVVANYDKPSFWSKNAVKILNWFGGNGLKGPDEQHKEMIESVNRSIDNMSKKIDDKITENNKRLQELKEQLGKINKNQ